MISVESNGPGELRIRTPFDRDYIDRMKFEISSNMRQWDVQEKVWIVQSSVFDEIHHLISEYFPGHVILISYDAQAEIDRYHEKPPQARQGESSHSIAISTGPYAVLFINDSAPNCVVDAAYKALAKLYHPDCGGDSGSMSRINSAIASIKKLRGE